MILLDNRCLHEPVSSSDRRRFSPKFLSRFNGLAVPVDIPYGDAQFLGRDPEVTVICEFTAPVNLAESVVHSGRILEQVRQAKAVCSHYFLMVWGDTDCDEDGRYCVRWYDREQRRTVLRPVVIREPKSNRVVAGPWQYQAVDNFLNSLSILCGVYVKKARDEAEMVRQTIDLFHWFSKRMDEHTTRLETAFYTPSFYPVDIPLSVRIAKEFKGFGSDKAHSLGRRFPTAVDLINASEDELLGPGVGKTLAASFYQQARAGRNGHR